MPNQVVVRVWWLMETANDPRGMMAFSRRKRAAISMGAGHGSVEIQRENRGSTYITWGPGGADGVGRTLASLTVGAAVGNGYTYDTDKRAYSSDGNPRVEDWSCTLPLRDPENAMSCGLDVEAMLEWWRNTRANLHEYKLLSKTKNCDGITVGALIAGGADSYAPPPYNLLYQGAYSITQWVPQVSAAIVSWNNNLEQARRILMQSITAPTAPAQANGHGTHGHGTHSHGTHGHGKVGTATAARTSRFQVAPPPPRVPQVPTVAQWKQMSRVLIGSRNEQIIKIDQYLAEYWAAPNQIIWHREKLRRNALLKILHQIYLHIALKPDSARHAAVRDLGVICLQAVTECHRAYTSGFNDAQRSMHTSSTRPYVDRSFDLHV